MPSPVPNPSSEIERLWTRTWDMRGSVRVRPIMVALGDRRDPAAPVLVRQRLNHGEPFAA